ncbi:HD family phosphohydrolase [Planococcus shenhongbingii]|uniref:HD family phosphohydrolase n=1 Tax=Planococcus shenhongbingii TaxID=3058398 RepID=UPI00260BA5C1|nr:HD family phosphohydrolase [Planococcus sp. N016]WKA60089.1 HD family phosphohydrolase [Planococcus sp. N016]
MQKRAKQLYDKAGYKVMATAIIFLIGLIAYAFLYSSVKSETYSISLFQLSEETIRSAKTVEDPIKTEEERQRVAAEIPPSYQFNDSLAGNQSAVINSLFGYILEAKQPTGKKSDKKPDIPKMVDTLRENLRLMETSDNGLRLTDDMLQALLLLPEDTLLQVEQVLIGIVERELKEPIREEDVSRIRSKVEQQLRENQNIPATVLQAMITIGRFSIVPNEVINEALTKAQIEQAKASVEPTRILQGQVLVQEGQVVDKEVYRQLELAGMTEEHQDYKPFIGLLLFVLIVLGILIVVTHRANATQQKKTTALLVIMAVLTISLTIMKLLSAVSGNFAVMIAFLFPTALAGMIVRMLLNERTAVYLTFLTGAIGSMMLQEGNAGTLQMDIALYIIFGGLTGVYLIEQADRRTRLLQTSLAVAVVNALFIGFYLLIGQSQYDWTEISFYFAAAIISGLLSGAMTIGLLPFFESAFGLLSTMKLIELSNPNHPLLKKILTETPGTYHHSVMVANLADASCEAIGANGLLARVGCYYHDIGKTKQPQFFIENQVNITNPHDSLPVETSSAIILAHGTYGAELLKKHKMPKEIVDVAAQHHGTSLLKFFYHKAKENDPNIEESAFRYSGPKPQTKEIAIISVADSIEAAVRSMKEPTSEKIKKLVDAIVEDKLKDGQFDECDLTMKELKTVKHIMCETLNGIFHTRIEYPKETS